MTAAATPDEHWRLGHRPALDGLRGVAVLLVIAAHYGVPYTLGGGATGVLIFFALSGFLITSLLLEELAETGRIAWWAFYGRRARRLFPALAIVLAAVLVTGYLLGEPRAVPQAMAAAGYIANLFPVQEPLGHAWTLSVEEQFYLVWPAIVIGVAMATRRITLILLALVGIAALVLLPGDYRLSAFGSIAAGCALGIVAVSGRLPTIRAPLAAVAVAVLAVATIVDYGPTLFPALRVGAVLASCALIAGAAATSHPILSWQPLRWIGRVSYGLYLWHVPVRWALDSVGVDPTWSPGMMLGLTLTFGIAALSWYLVERPILLLGQPKLRRVVPRRIHVQ